jgi:ketosteroid isomerase-like protein
MTKTAHQIVRDFFAAMSSGTLSADMLTDDMTAWTTSSGVHVPRDRYVGGSKMLQTIFDGGIHYTVDSITAEDDRAAAEVRAQGKLINGEDYANTYVFMFRIRDGKIASLAEHFNPDPMRSQLGPLIQQVMAKTTGTTTGTTTGGEK